MYSLSRRTPLQLWGFALRHRAQYSYILVLSKLCHGPLISSGAEHLKRFFTLAYIRYITLMSLIFYRYFSILTCVGIFNDHFITNIPLSVLVQESYK